MIPRKKNDIKNPDKWCKAILFLSSRSEGSWFYVNISRVVIKMESTYLLGWARWLIKMGKNPSLTSTQWSINDYLIKRLPSPNQLDPIVLSHHSFKKIPLQWKSLWHSSDVSAKTLKGKKELICGRESSNLLQKHTYNMRRNTSYGIAMQKRWHAFSLELSLDHLLHLQKERNRWGQGRGELTVRLSSVSTSLTDMEAPLPLCTSAHSSLKWTS